jgi:hypothetical protein
LKASGIVALSSMELNSGLTAFADNQSDGSKSHIERYHRYDFDTKEELRITQSLYTLFLSYRG